MKIVFSLLAATLLFGCASKDVDLDYNSQINFNQINRYALQAPPAESNPLNNERIQGAIEAQLAAKGWQLLPPNATPNQVNEVSIGYQNWVESRYKESDFNIGIGLGRSTGRSSIGGAVNFPIGSNEEIIQVIRIDMFQQGQLIWRASDHFVQEAGDSPEYRISQTNQVVARLLAQFPPTP